MKQERSRKGKVREKAIPKDKFQKLESKIEEIEKGKIIRVNKPKKANNS